MKLLLLNRAEVGALLDLPAATALVERAMRALSRRETQQLLRQIVPLPQSSGVLSGMLGTLGERQPFGLKCLSVFASRDTNRPSHRGTVTLFDPETGEPVAILEAGLLTAIRTAAATAIATHYLARTDARTLGIFGAGEQAHWHVPALLTVRRFDLVRVWGRTHASASRFATTVAERYHIRCEAVVAPQAAAASDVVCTLTSAQEPILKGDWIQDGTHVNLVGSSNSVPTEVDTELVVKARYFADWRESASEQASELLYAMRSGAVEASHLLGEIGEVAEGALRGRLTDRDVTIYKSLGVIVQDLVCGWHVYQQACAAGRGTWVDL